MELFSLTGEEVSLITHPLNRLRSSHFLTENFFSLGTNNPTYQGGRYEPSFPVSNNLLLLVAFKVKNHQIGYYMGRVLPARFRCH